jgi:hypothetical protein
MFDGDSDDLLPEHRDRLATMVEGLDRCLSGQKTLRAIWVGDQPSTEESLTASELATSIRQGRFRQGVSYRVSWNG